MVLRHFRRAALAAPLAGVFFLGSAGQASAEPDPVYNDGSTVSFATSSWHIGLGSAQVYPAGNSAVMGIGNPDNLQSPVFKVPTNDLNQQLDWENIPEDGCTYQGNPANGYTGAPDYPYWQWATTEFQFSLEVTGRTVSGLRAALGGSTARLNVFVYDQTRSTGYFLKSFGNNLAHNQELPESVNLNQFGDDSIQIYLQTTQDYGSGNLFMVTNPVIRWYGRNSGGYESPVQSGCSTPPDSFYGGTPHYIVPPIHTSVA